MQGELAIVPSACIVKAGEIKTLSVLAKNDLVQRAGVKVLLTEEGEGIELMSSEVLMAPRTDRPDIFSGTCKVRGAVPASLVLVKASSGKDSDLVVLNSSSKRVKVTSGKDAPVAVASNSWYTFRGRSGAFVQTDTGACFVFGDEPSIARIPSK
jgi:hypothetical protein